MTSMTASAPRVRLKTVAIPAEHGSWGFLLEPLLLGLLLAPSWAGLSFALAAIGAFLARHPLKIALADRWHGKRYARTILAERFALGYSLLALAGIVPALLLAGAEILLPLLLALPLVAVLFASYLNNRWRALLPELAGACAMAVSAASIVLAGGESWTLALAAWAILVARDVPSILYVRARLRLDKGQPFSRRGVLAANGGAIAALIALAAAGYTPWLVVGALVMLLARAAWGLSARRRPVRVQTIGFLEMAYGLLVVISAALGHSLGV